ncbi:MAG: hypothetical protein HRU25_14605 [Psychrobium sp.]|nr:hypothetical protein [Psychrobium sp.]
MLADSQNSAYSQSHFYYHDSLKNMIKSRAFYDLFLVGAIGNIFNSVKKESDFSINLRTGQWRDSELARVFSRINDQADNRALVYSDFTHYPPSGGDPASFVGTVFFDRSLTYIGAVIFQLPIFPLDNIMQVSAGMGMSGETYLVEPDLLMCSNSRFFNHRSILNTKIDTLSVNCALNGWSGIYVIDDYRGVSVLSAYTSVSFLGTTWAMLAEIDEEEMLAPVYALSQFLLFSGVSYFSVRVSVGQ